jgi:DNA primase
MNKEHIKKIKEKVNIYGLLSHFGIQYQGRSVCCPFHNDTSPSATINADNIFCHACSGGKNRKSSKSYDVVDIVQKMKGCSFQEAVEFLEKFVGEMPETPIHNNGNWKDKKVPALEKAVSRAITEAGREVHKFFLEQLGLTETGKDFLRKRGFNNDIAEKYKIKALDEPQLHFASLRQKFPEEILIESGLVAISKRGNPYLTLFREGVLIPFLNPDGDPEYFTVRSYHDEPKYLKIKGIQQPTFTGADFYTSEEVFCLEGVFDCLAYEAITGKSNFFSFVGLPGVGQMRKFVQDNPAKQVILALDNDESGRKRTDELADTIEGLSLFNWKKFLKNNAVAENVYIKDLNDFLLFSQGGGDNV